jgi:hypothetical protein
VAEGRHVEVAAGNARLPGQGQCPDPAAEADADVADPSSELAVELQQRADARPKVLDAAAEDVAVAQVDVVEHVPGGVGRDRRSCAAAQTAEAGHQVDRVRAGQVEVRPLDAAVAVPDDEAAPDRTLLWLQQPVADPKAVGRAIGQIPDPQSRA